ncbi:hypothetical protein RJ640_004111 [Escallonia rubra]|uniref:LysM domain receptor-like kinase 4 n=1 Tax=Escallonia rubra TaxID=112253 RepID=A0AA88RX92_9ASTE|nr:hypothetical protein RJ640_004111 [Escallonia rubra]
MVYRANQEFNTISNISNLFNMPPDGLLFLNNIKSPSEYLTQGREVLVPISCSCYGHFSQANFTYIVPDSATFADIACGVYEGLVKSVTLVEGNQWQGNHLTVGSILHLPLKCACPDNFSASVGVKYLVTYPIVEFDYTEMISKKFGIPPEDIWVANNLEPGPTVYPNTTVLVPLKKEPSINLSVFDPQPPIPSFLPTLPVQQARKNTKKLYIAGSVIGFFLVVLASISCALYVKALKKQEAEHIPSFAHRSSCSTPRSSPISGPTTSTNSCLSPDLLAGLKYTLCNYSTEEIRRATRNFSEDSKMSGDLYKGLLDDVEVMIKQMKFDDTRQVIDLHSKINHGNIVKLLGVCYGENELSCSYLVFEFPNGGCLRECLSHSSYSLRWHRRTQIAFDIATGLHYLHYCMVPPYTNMSIKSRNIFVTTKSKAKLAVLGQNPSVGSAREYEAMVNLKGWVEPEHHLNGLTHEKVDIFAFGIVLLELISAREDTDGKLLRESIGFLGGGASEGGCFEQLRNFMDPCLKEDYPLAEALCLAVLAKACVEDEPLHRPSVDDIMKVLARMV